MKYSIEKRYFKITPTKHYRYGKPEGVCLHFTANYKSTLDSELAYMARNVKNAFVQGYVDANHCVECANPDMGAYGAGSKANGRFIHIELCVAHDQVSFERSFDRYCWMAAYYLRKYNLPLIAAKINGSGTLWTHWHVTNYLGGTTHTDPFNYLKKWGIDVNDLYTRVAKHYNELGEITEGVNNMMGLKEFQASLNTLAYLGANGRRLVEDGINGANTRHAVINFQRDNGLVTDGVVGQKTWEAMTRALKAKREEDNLNKAVEKVAKTNTNDLNNLDAAVNACEALLKILKEMRC